MDSKTQLEERVDKAIAWADGIKTLRHDDLPQQPAKRRMSIKRGRLNPPKKAKKKMARKKNPYDTKQKMKNVASDLWSYRGHEIEILRTKDIDRKPVFHAKITRVAPLPPDHIDAFSADQDYVPKFLNKDIPDVLEMARLAIDRVEYRNSLTSGSYRKLFHGMHMNMASVFFRLREKTKSPSRAAVSRELELMRREARGRQRLEFQFFNKLSVKDRTAWLNAALKELRLMEGLPLTDNPRIPTDEQQKLREEKRKKKLKEASLKRRGLGPTAEKRRRGSSRRRLTPEEIQKLLDYEDGIEPPKSKRLKKLTPEERMRLPEMKAQPSKLEALILRAIEFVNSKTPGKISRSAVARQVEYEFIEPGGTEPKELFYDLPLKERLKLLDSTIQEYKRAHGIKNPRKKAKKKVAQQKTGEYTVKIFRGKHAGTTRTYKSRKGASRACDKLDLEYGAICSNVVLPEINPPKKAKKKVSRRKNGEVIRVDFGKQRGDAIVLPEQLHHAIYELSQPSPATSRFFKEATKHAKSQADFSKIWSEFAPWILVDSEYAAIKSIPRGYSRATQAKAAIQRVADLYRSGATRAQWERAAKAALGEERGPEPVRFATEAAAHAAATQMRGVDGRIGAVEVGPHNAGKAIQATVWAAKAVVKIGEKKAKADFGKRLLELLSDTSGKTTNPRKKAKKKVSRKANTGLTPPRLTKKQRIGYMNRWLDNVMSDVSGHPFPGADGDKLTRSSVARRLQTSYDNAQSIAGHYDAYEYFQGLSIEERIAWIDEAIAKFKSKHFSASSSPLLGQGGALNPRKKAKKKAKKKAPTAQSLVAKCQKLWGSYCKKPGITKLRAVVKHCDAMKASTAKSVKAECTRCMRSVRAEAKARGWKL